MKAIFGSAGVLVATTIGAGIFALPYVFLKAGWFLGLFYLVALSAILYEIHALFARASLEGRGRSGLTGLLAKHFGRTAAGLGSVAIAGGLLLALVVYLILSSGFVELLGFQGGSTGVLVFWLAATLPIALNPRRFAWAEAIGAIAIAALIGIVFLNATSLSFGAAPLADWSNALLPFGPVLFALTGWTAIEPMRDYHEKTKSVKRFLPALRSGTAGIAVLYLMFAMGILGSGLPIAPNTVSGLAGWPDGLRFVFGILGLIALWTSYVPIGREIKNALAVDLAWPSYAASTIVFLTPPLLFSLGLTSFLAVVGLAGGIFLSVQYLLIALVCREASRPNPNERIFLNFATALFLLAAVYEVYHFIVG